MPNVLIVVLLALVLAAALAALIAILRRPTSAPMLDENAIRRLLTETIGAPALNALPGDASQVDSSPLGAGQTDALQAAGRVSIEQEQLALSQLRQEASAAASEISRVAAAAADALRERSDADASALRQQARSDADKTLELARSEALKTVEGAKAEAAGFRSAVQSERQRLAQEAVDSLATERAELQEAQHDLRDAAASVTQAQQSLAQEQDRVTLERQELGRSRSAVDNRESDLRTQAADLVTRAAEMDLRAVELTEQLTVQHAELTRISGLTIPAARAELLASQEQAVRRDAAFMIRRVESEAEATAKTKARAIVAEAVQRVASDQTAQTVVSVVHLPADEVKGRIIGREGRNIRTFETITGVNVIIDDTPEAVLLSCFDPVRREVGRITLQMLIDDGRIHPHRIEEAFERAGEEVEELCRRAAEDAMLDVGISDLHPELVNLIGRLKYRTSYGQNVLGHMVETSHIGRIMASEMGIDAKIVARGAFLHDIGKALTHEAQGSHAIVGAQLARKYGESEAVSHCIEAHHDEVLPSTVEAVLTQAADSCSGGRPGARRESLESYVQRLERIEAIASSKKGVEKVFAMQAGRELRVMVKPEVVDDLEAHLLAREVAKQIEEELTYPGQVRVTVIRESRATEIAR